MTNGKVTAVQLYLSDLKKSGSGFSYLNYKLASERFKKLSLQQQDSYKVKAAKLNGKLQSKAVYTTQKDTLGTSLKEVEEQQTRLRRWQHETDSKIQRNCKDEAVFDREIYLGQVTGTYYNNAFNNDMLLATAELTIVKFSFNKGIIDELILYPEIVNVPIGHREKLYEDVEEEAGYRPDTFEFDHSRKHCFEELRRFFQNKIEPIFVATQEHAEKVACALHTIYDTADVVCPWIKSFQDWGLDTKIYKLETLVYHTVNQHSNEKLKLSDILRQWQRMCLDMGPEPCERHVEYGRYHQCARNVLRKHLFCTVIMVHSVCYPNRPLDSLLSENFMKNINWIIPEEPELLKVKPPSNNKSLGSSDWGNYYSKGESIEDIIKDIQNIDIRKDSGTKTEKEPNLFLCGRGRSRIQSTEAHRVPGTSKSNVSNKVKKLKLPKVIC